jgi:hypothetical protein
LWVSVAGLCAGCFLLDTGCRQSGAWRFSPGKTSVAAAAQTLPENLVRGMIPSASTPLENPLFLTDGNAGKEQFTGAGMGLQWIQFDLGASRSVAEIRLWHFFDDGRTYHDVIAQLSDTADFSSAVTTVYNNDADNSAGLGAGADPEYAESAGGKSIRFKPVTARYLRLWVNGSSVNAWNHYSEVEVYGEPFSIAPAGRDLDPAGLLFRSGFEDGTRLDPIDRNADGDFFQHFSGVDNSTSYEWPLTLWQARAATTGIHSIAGSGNRVSSYVNNYLETVPGPSGQPTRALRMGISGPSPRFCCIQSMFQIAGMQQPVRSVYVRAWMKLNPEVAAQAEANQRDFWRTLFELKTLHDYRLAAFVVANAAGRLSWRASADNNPDGSRPPCPPNACWTQDNTTLPAKVDEWFLQEFYLERSAGGDGRFFWAVNGNVLVDRHGPALGAYQENVHFLALSALYGDGKNMSPAYQWLDDLEIWDRPPCPSLPCGLAGTASSGNR